MKKIIIVTVLLTVCNASFSQTKYLDRKIIDKLTDSIEAEGKTLYRSEWASWYGSDIFTGKFPDKRARIGGYISYETKAGMYNVFFSKDDRPVVLSTIFFGNDFNPDKYTIDTTARNLTAIEKEYYEIRRAAVKRMGVDTIFKSYNNSSLNPVPVIQNGSKRVYVLTGPNINGVVLYGNDYQIDFNKKNEITSVKKLHNTLIVVKSGKETDSTRIILSSMHSHVEGKDPFITATDICTSMLYHQFTTWNTVVVISKDYVSNWDCNKNELVILTTDAWNKIYGIKSSLSDGKH